MNARRLDEMMIESEMHVAALVKKWQTRFLGDRALRGIEEGADGLYQDNEEADELAGREYTGEDTEAEPEAA